MTSQPDIVAVDPLTDPRWDAFVRKHSRANAYHLAAWAGILRASYGYRPHYLEAQDPRGGRLLGVLPLVSASGIVFGRRWSSMPVAWTAGPLGADSGVERVLLAEAMRLARADRARKAVIRSSAGGLEAGVPGVRAEIYDPVWILDLPDTITELEDRWRTDNHLWRNLRKAGRAGLTVRQGSSEADLDAFYRVYLRTMRKLRSLPRRRRQLSLTRQALGDAFKLFLVEHAGEVVAGAVLHAFGGTAELIYSASDERQLRLRPNHALYRASIGWAVENDFGKYDFGGAGEGTGLADFKRQWGASPHSIYVYGWSARDGEGVAAARHEVPSGGVVGEVWRRAPLAGVQLAGALAYRYL